MLSTVLAPTVLSNVPINTWSLLVGEGGDQRTPPGASVPRVVARGPGPRSSAAPPALGAAPGCARLAPSRYQAYPALKYFHI